MRTSEKEWINNQYEPEEKLFVGRRPPRKPKAWMMKPEAREERTEKEIEEREDEYLKRHGIH